VKRTVLVLFNLSLSHTTFAADSCDRACLRGFETTYLNALVAHNPSALPAAANVKFTEDNVQRKLGEGLWQTASISP
jgi:hypothetical protein